LIKLLLKRPKNYEHYLR